MIKHTETISLVAMLACLFTAVSANAQSLEGIFTIQQVSNNRFVDAHESNANPTNDFSLVTRTAQNNDTQRWRFTPVDSDVYLIQQVSNNRFVDAHENDTNPTNDFTLVTRTEQANDTQRWRLTSLGNNVYTIQQVSTGRFMDAHESDTNPTNDFTLVTRTVQNNDTQRWRLTPAGGGRLLNISTNGPVDVRGMIAGFIVESAGQFAILAEGEGPSPITDPILNLDGQFLNDSGQFQALPPQSNDNWNNADSADLMAIIGRLPNSANAAAIVIDLRVGVYNATITGKNGETGTGIIAVTKR